MKSIKNRAIYLSMRLVFMTFLVTLLTCSLYGCNSLQSESRVLIQSDTVKNVSITSLPEGYEYSFTGDDVKVLADYFNKLELNANFKENPNEYSGMTWVVCFEDENGDTTTLYHFGNMFIRTEDGPWYQMTYEEASGFDALLYELNK